MRLPIKVFSDETDYFERIFQEANPILIHGGGREFLPCAKSSIQRRHGHKVGRLTVGIGPKPMNRFNFMEFKHDTYHFARHFRQLAVVNSMPDNSVTNPSLFLSRAYPQSFEPAFSCFYIPCGDFTFAMTLKFDKLKSQRWG